MNNFLPDKTKIAGSKTVAMWRAIREDLNVFENKNLWYNTYYDFFIERIKERYFNPIESIKKNDKCRGEGFAIMTIICSLIEFLESTYEGSNYKHKNPNPPFEYNDKSRDFFKYFLTKRIPDKIQVSNDCAEQFYWNVRCGLLHEARTCGKWVIHKVNINGLIIEDTNSKINVYRDNFYDCINEYINVQYKSELLASDELKRAFLRKFDKLCEE